MEVRKFSFELGQSFVARLEKTTRSHQISQPRRRLEVRSSAWNRAAHSRCEATLLVDEQHNGLNQIGQAQHCLVIQKLRTGPQPPIGKLQCTSINNISNLIGQAAAFLGSSEVQLRIGSQPQHTKLYCMSITNKHRLNEIGQALALLAGSEVRLWTGPKLCCVSRNNTGLNNISLPKQRLERPSSAWNQAAASRCEATLHTCRQHIAFNKIGQAQHCLVIQQIFLALGRNLL